MLGYSRGALQMVEKIMEEPGLSRIMLGAICALLAWNVYTTHLLAVQVAVLEESMKGLKVSMVALEQRP